jgi:hypothetical protein
VGSNEIQRRTARRRCIDGVTQIVDEFFKLKNGDSGTVKACDF